MRQRLGSHLRVQSDVEIHPFVRSALAMPPTLTMPEPPWEVFGRRVAVLERECERIDRDPATIRRSAHIGLVRDAQQRRDVYGVYAGPDVGGAVLYGSDGRLIEGVRALEGAGADQVLFAGSVLEGTEQLEWIAGLLAL